MESRELLAGVVAVSCLLFVSCALGQQPAQLLYQLPPDLPKMSGPGVPLGRFLKPDQGKAVLDLTLAQSPTVEAWKARVEYNKKHMQQGLGLDPWPKRNPLNAIVRDKRAYDGY